MKGKLIQVLICVVTVIAMLLVCEAILRLKNSAGTNYDIEMWKYARELKRLSPNHMIGHEHIPSKEATLQNVTIRINEWGLRGGPVSKVKPPRRILFLGSSITLGWGVEEEKTFPVLLEKIFRDNHQQVEVLNGGVGNFNSQRYAELFLTKLKDLKPDDVVVQYFLRDAEEIVSERGNFFLRNNQVAVTLWIAWNRIFGKTGESSLIEHYHSVYQPKARGYQAMRAALHEIATYCKAHGIRCYMVMTPDIHNLKDYPFKFIHERMAAIAKEEGYIFIDLLPIFNGLNPRDVWAMPGDPHPNSFGHKLMAEYMAKRLKLK